jgi:hypothetical protein
VSEPNAVLKGGRRRAYHAGYCQACWDGRTQKRAAEIDRSLTPEQHAVLALLETEVADEAERRHFAEQLGLVGEPA